MKVMALAGATWTILRMRAAMSPASSATPTPIIATRITATTPKSLKFWTTVVKICRMPSADSRLRTSIVSVTTSYSGRDRRVPARSTDSWNRHRRRSR